jgi:hypothetical protein
MLPSREMNSGVTIRLMVTFLLESSDEIALFVTCWLAASWRLTLVRDDRLNSRVAENGPERRHAALAVGDKRHLIFRVGKVVYYFGDINR